MKQRCPEKGMLHLLYETVPGRFLLKGLTRPGLSRFAGRVLSTRASRILIKPFIRRNHMDMTPYERVEYGSFNDFFSRKIRLSQRPLDPDPDALISPSDSKLTAVPITRDGIFRIKHANYTLKSLLRNEELASRFEGGWALIFRLSVDDYHRYCYSADGQKEANVRLPGILHTVQPIAVETFPALCENSREYCLIHTERFGDMIAMEVGALLVGKIVNHHPERECVKRGVEKGFFQYGGSTVVLLLEPGRLQPEALFVHNSEAGKETPVRYGQRVGTAMIRDA